ncbi:response regulator transcription factor [Rhodobacteraceae bacterium 10Alg 79]|uniref:Response regulator transcription factor n=1 Tax=Rhodalgimonas zhirmunskyi TaxID=2964767 RepID=A0AAJ1UAR7_9RHOB|nr:response regulator transcription factor [Rhodoalgimonas zhirmunskyi]
MESRPEFSILATTGKGVEAIALARRHRPDIAVLDYVMPDATGLDVFKEIACWSPETRSVIVTGSDSAATLQSLNEAGVHGIFLKAQEPRDICDGLLRVAAGEVVRARQVMKILTASIENSRITRREQQVLTGIAQGLSNPGIAMELSISPKTVESHRASLMRKLGVHSSAALIVRAVREGLLDP